MEIRGKVVIITGAASGLGEACARKLAERGASIAVFDINKENGARVAAEVNGLFVECDVTSEEAVQNAVSQACGMLGRIDITVNCAGLLIGEKILGKKGPHRLSTFNRVIGINLIGTFNVLRLTAEQMVRNDPNPEGERGVIINTSSIAAFEGQLGQCAYSASKAGIVGLTLPAARELAKNGIRVCSIAPGVFNTAMLAGLPEEFRQALAAQVPFPGRLGNPGEFAALACHIVENPMLNGEVIRLDGAMRMGAR